jgi:opacity protein-like surface antigen
LDYLRVRNLGLAAGALLLLFGAPSRASAEGEWQIRPFIGVTFGGGTTLYDGDNAVGKTNVAFGASGSFLGEVVGLEADFAIAPGFFEAGNAHFVSSSHVTTFTGNVIIGPPLSATEYSLRPYFVGGFGVMRAQSSGDLPGTLGADMTRPAFDVGGGVSGALSERTALSWELRYFRSFRGNIDPIGNGLERLFFWRGNMAFVIRL